MLPVAGITIRPMAIADIPAGLWLCRASGWNQTERDWQTFLHAAPRGALVAEESGTVVGSVATMPYGRFTWISMVLVDPKARGQGIGTLLLERGLALVAEGSAARLDATPAGEVLYRKLGFTAEYGLARWFLDEARPLQPAPHCADGIARPFEATDWPAVREMDLRAFGASRLGLLDRLAHEAPEYAWVLGRAGGGLCGFLFGRHGYVREHLGPLVADDHQSAGALLDSCLASHPRRAMFIDAPDDQLAWRDALSAAGFAIERPFLRMHRGRLTAPGDPSLIFAIAGPEFG
jgi:GNAT superfamily N-acetyltransferase